jgi:hypothetical protein
MIIEGDVRSGGLATASLQGDHRRPSGPIKTEEQTTTVSWSESGRNSPAKRQRLADDADVDAAAEFHENVLTQSQLRLSCASHTPKELLV